MAISQEFSAGPSAESLSLAASLFTSQISSWIPANFGQSSNSTSKTTQPSLDSVLQTDSDRGERLGLGHPLLDVPKYQRRQEASSSLSTLGKRMGLDKGKGKAQDESEVGLKESRVESEDEEESRVKIGKKRKVDKVDIFAAKKKTKTKTKSEPISDPTPSATPAQQTPSTEYRTTKQVNIVPDTSVSSDTSLPISKTETTTTTPTPALDGLNKNQRKKLRKKQKKLAQVDR